MATTRQKLVAKKVIESNGKKPVSKAMIEAGYPATTARNPQQITNSKGWNELMEEFLSDTELSKRHQELLRAMKIEHMVFPLGPRTNRQKQAVEALPDNLSTILDAEIAMQQTDLSDKEIEDLLGTVGCTVKKIVHGETCRHVYYWAMDAKARKDALDMAYKLKGKYAPEKSVNLNIEVEADPVIKDLTAKLNDIYRQNTLGRSDAQDPDAEVPEAVSVLGEDAGEDNLRPQNHAPVVEAHDVARKDAGTA